MRLQHSVAQLAQWQRFASDIVRRRDLSPDEPVTGEDSYGYRTTLPRWVFEADELVCMHERNTALQQAAQAERVLRDFAARLMPGGTITVSPTQHHEGAKAP